MLIIVDKKIPEKAKHKLKKFGELVEFETKGITYEAISGHPDIFFCQIAEQLVVAPNIPQEYFDLLDEKGIRYIKGEQEVGDKYPMSSCYNIVADKKHIIHNFRNTDYIVNRIGEGLDLIHVDQGYTRCNLISLENDHYISSDKGIEKTLNRFNKNVLFVNPQPIQLPGFSHGFFGGCVGIQDSKFFVIGSLKHLDNESEILEFVSSRNYEVIELYDGSLFDGGSILFLE